MSYGQYAQGTFTNAGTIVGAGGILVSGGNAFFVNNGHVVGTTNSGVYLSGGGLILNTQGAEITGRATGIYAGTGGMRVQNFGGTITGNVAAGLASLGDSYLRNVNGTVRGNSVGAYFRSGTIINDGGLITGDNGTGVLLGVGGTVSQTKTGGISGRDVGVRVANGNANVYNYGYIASNGGTNTGIGIDAGNAVGNILNFSGGFVFGGGNGVVLSGNHGSSQLQNGGVIVGRYGAGVAINGSRADTSVYVLNDGSIGGYSGIKGTGNVVVNNFGTVTGNYDTGVRLDGDTAVINQAGGVISGNNVGVALYGSHAQVGNYGTISSVNTGIALGANGSVVNAGGTILGQNGSGVVLLAGGQVRNQQGGGHSGSIYGHYYGVLASGAGRATVTNTGGIYGGFTGVDLRVAGRVTNAGGVIRGGQGSGVILEAGGSVTNGNSGAEIGVVVGNRYGVLGQNSAVQVANSGAIVGGVYGVYLFAGGNVANAAGGLIRGNTNGVVVVGGDATVVNAGTLSGARDAVQFRGGGNHRLILQQGSVIEGKLEGGGANGTLEFAAGTGKVAGLGTSISGFGQIAVDNGAKWTVTGQSTVAAGTTLTAAGTLIETGPTTLAGTMRTAGTGIVRVNHALTMASGSVLAVNKTGTVEIGTTGLAKKGVVTVEAGNTLRGAGLVSSSVRDDGSVRASGGTLHVTGSIVGRGTTTIDSHSVLSVDGSLGGAQLVFLAGGDEVARLGAPTSVSAVISGFGATDTLDLVGFAATRLSFANDILTVSRASGSAAHLHFSSAYTGHHFAFGSDGHGGTNINVI